MAGLFTYWLYCKTIIPSDSNYHGECNCKSIYKPKVKKEEDEKEDRDATFSKP